MSAGVRGRNWRTRAATASLVAGLALVGLGGCGDDGDDDAATDDNLDDDVEEVTESAGARAVAEALRGTILAEDLEQDEDRRQVAVLTESVDDLPGEPEITGIEDRDGDGLDDDGNVGVRVDDEVACLSVAPDGDVDVTGGAC